MKRMTFMVILLLAILAIGATAQSNRIPIFSGRAYPASVDTSAWISVPSMSQLRLVVMARDSFNMALTVQYTVNGAKGTVLQAYTVTGTDSTNSAADSGFVAGYKLRDYAADNIPGAELARLLTTRKVTKNGTTSATFDAWFVKP